MGAIFLLGFCFLLVHEMDAVRRREWKILPGLNRLSEGPGYVAFAALHVPLYALLLWGLLSEANRGLIVGLDVFFIVHMFLHFFLRNLSENRFSSVLSWVLILGAGVCGTLDLLLMLSESLDSWKPN